MAVDVSAPGSSPAVSTVSTTAPARAAASGRNLVVCCDGTNNTLTGGVEDTNVLMLYAYLRQHTDPGRTVLFYDPGVGTPDAAPPTDLTDLIKRKATRIAGLASGRGVYDNIADAYRFLMQQWQGPQDRIFCFGFSRGAFTARCVVGMVNLFGVIGPEHEVLLPTLIRIYFSQPAADEQVAGRKNLVRALTRYLHEGLARPDKAGSETAQPSEESTKQSTEQSTRSRLAEQVRRGFGIDDPKRRAAVHWVGVWDTVESVGLPVLFSRDNPATASFRDKPGIRNVRHALALDEHRLAFRPRLYDEPHRLDLIDEDGHRRTLRQLWFPGVHCDVGGSYAIDSAGLADIAWLWMFNEVAGEFGLKPLAALPRPGESTPFADLGMPRHQPFPAPARLRHDALWDTPLWALAGMTVRRMTTERVATVGQRKKATDEGRDPDQEGALVDVATADVPLPPPGPSVWDARRKLWPLAAVVVLVGLGLLGSGWNLIAPADAAPWTDLPRQACLFAAHQLASAVGSDVLPAALADGLDVCGPVAPTGLRDPLAWQGYLARSPVWALLCDLLVIAGLGYLIARAGSRGFTFLAGVSRPGRQRSRWLAVAGLLPVSAVLLDVGENLLTLIAIALERVGTPWPVPAVLWLVGAASLFKLLFYLANVALYGSLRVWLAVTSGPEVGRVGR